MTVEETDPAPDRQIYPCDFARMAPALQYVSEVSMQQRQPVEILWAAHRREFRKQTVRGGEFERFFGGIPALSDYHSKLCRA